MALWHCELKVSRHSRLFSSGVHGVIMLAALLAPWPANGFYLWFPLFVIIMVSWVWSQTNIRRCQGRLALFSGQKMHWQKAAWKLTRPPWLSRYGMVITLHAFDKTESIRHRSLIRLWVASDSMPPKMWRHLNQLMHQYPDI
ncbi:protein YgfX [Xenorhabdus bovienii]|uniref:protein YgfX n=1 Tax=Xenorhabdus bovienii TaxID=40576 RepID=UPI0023B3357B|nr:protein YgfX [Xenorhabdus bovienii]MDE9458609.1 protein YgfX [Xenorhabdus bovienii]MDE9514841.1 protein YgfX [Xenorhabdus bovienii]